MTDVISDSIRAAIQPYFDGHATDRAAVMQRAFMKNARLQFVQDGRYAEVAREYLARLAGRAPDDESNRTRRIIAVQATDDAATACVELDYPGVRFVDHLTLLLVDNDWIIVNKAFQAFPKSDVPA